MLEVDEAGEIGVPPLANGGRLGLLQRLLLAFELGGQPSLVFVLFGRLQRRRSGVRTRPRVVVLTLNLAATSKSAKHKCS